MATRSKAQPASPRKKATKKVSAGKKPTTTRTSRIARPAKAGARRESGKASAPDKGFVVLLDSQKPSPAVPDPEDSPGFVLLLDEPGPQEAPEDHEIVLGEECSIQDIGQLRDRMLMVLAAAKPVEIRADSVREIDCAALQLLTAFDRHARGQGIEVTWHGGEGPVQSMAASLDLKRYWNNS